MVVGSMSVATLFVREKTVADWHTRKASTLPSLERLHDSSDSLARPLVLHIGNLYHCTVDCVYSPAVACLPCHCWHSVCLDFELLMFTFASPICSLTASAVAAIHQLWSPLRLDCQLHCRASISLLYLPVPIRKCQYWLNTHSSQHTYFPLFVLFGLDSVYLANYLNVLPNYIRSSR